MKSLFMNYLTSYAKQNKIYLTEKEQIDFKNGVEYVITCKRYGESKLREKQYTEDIIIHLIKNDRANVIFTEFRVNRKKFIQKVQELFTRAFDAMNRMNGLL